MSAQNPSSLQLTPVDSPSKEFISKPEEKDKPSEAEILDGSDPFNDENSQKLLNKTEGKLSTDF